MTTVVAAGYHNIEIRQGAAWTMTAQYCAPTSVPNVPGAPVDVTDWGAKMQIRKTDIDATAIIDLEIGSGITVDGPNGLFTFHMDGAITLGFDFALGVYDAFIYPPGDEIPFLTGSVLLDRSAVR